MRLVICDGIQYDADNLPPNVDAKQCVPADQWFADNRRTEKPAPKPAPKPAASATEEAAPRESSSKRRRGAKTSKS